MIFPYMVKHNGKFYNPGEDVAMSKTEEYKAQKRLKYENEQKAKFDSKVQQSRGYSLGGKV